MLQYAEWRLCPKRRLVPDEFVVLPSENLAGYWVCELEHLTCPVAAAALAPRDTRLAVTRSEAALWAEGDVTIP